MATKKPNLLSLFSGAGGLDKGFKNAGFNIKVSNEIDKVTFETYEKNFPTTRHIKGSIVNLIAEDIDEEFDGIIGGPPCQSWSEAGSQKGINDPRGKLFFEYIRILNIVKPKFFLAENVSGILHQKHAQALQNITQKFADCGYKIKYELHDAVTHGVPQTRKRVFIVGIRNDINVDFKFPDIIKVEKQKTLFDAISDLPKSIPAREKNLTNFKFDKISTNEVANHEHMIGGFSTIFMSRNRVRSWDEPSFTIQAGGRHAPIHPDAPKMVKYGKNDFRFVKQHLAKYRRLSVRECARVQTFPDDFVFYYKQVANGYKMIGNAVPVLLAEVIAQEIKKQIF